VTAPARPAWVYARDMIAEAMQAKVLTKDEACRITTGSSSVIIASWACCAQTKFAVITSKAISVENKRGRGRRTIQMRARTLTGYGISVVIVLAIVNGIVWLMGSPLLHDLNVFSAGFVLGMPGMYIAAWLYGYRQVNSPAAG